MTNDQENGCIITIVALLLSLITSFITLGVMMICNASIKASFGGFIVVGVLVFCISWGLIAKLTTK